MACPDKALNGLPPGQTRCRRDIRERTALAPVLDKDDFVVIREASVRNIRQHEASGMLLAPEHPIRAEPRADHIENEQRRKPQQRDEAHGPEETPHDDGGDEADSTADRCGA